MTHWEKDSEVARRENEYYQKLYKVREELEITEIGKFMATDLPSLLRLQNFSEQFNHGPFYGDLELIANRLKQIKGSDSKEK